MANDINVKIGADTKEFDSALDNVSKRLEGMEKNLASVAKASGITFAAITAAATGAIVAYADAEKTTKQLTIALQNQGIASDKLLKKYGDLADQVQEKTGIDDDAIKSGLGVLQNFLGQTEASEGLAEALADLSEKTGSVESAAQILGRGIAGNARGLKQFGITIDETATKEERIAAITEQVNQKFGGLAQSANSGLGGIRGLNSAVGNLFEAIGQRLAPVVSVVIAKLTQFFNKINANKPLLDFIVSIGIVAAEISGAILVLASAGLAIVKFASAISVAKTAITSLGVASKIAVGATGLGLVLVVVGTIASQWETIFPVLQAIFETFVNNVAKLSSGVGSILNGVFTLNPAAIKAGLAEIETVVAEGFQKIAATAKDSEISGPGVSQDPKKIAAAKAANDAIIAEEKRKKDILTAENELILLQTEEHSQAVIDLKNKEIEILKQLDDEKYAGQTEALTAHLEQVRLLQEQALLTESEQKTTFQNDILAKDAEFNALSDEQKNLFLAQNQVKLQEQIQTEQTTRDAALNERLQKQIAAHNQFLADQQKFGTAYAEINKTINSNEVQGVSQAAGQLSQLQNSKSKELKAIGKAAAIADITIKTAQSAMAIFTGFAAIPIVGPALGVAGAAAAVAFGVEQIATVVAAQDGGIVPGVSMGGDSTRAILEPGELVVPRANFSEVVNAVASQRIQDSPSATSGISAGAATGGTASITIGFEGGEAEKVLTARQVEARSLGILREANA